MMAEKQIRELQKVDEARIYDAMQSGQRKKDKPLSNKKVLESILEEFGRHEDNRDRRESLGMPEERVDYKAVLTDHLKYVRSTGTPVSAGKEQILLETFVDEYQNWQFAAERMPKRLTTKLKSDFKFGTYKFKPYGVTAIIGGVGGLLGLLVAGIGYGDGYWDTGSLPLVVGLGLAAEAALFGWPLVKYVASRIREPITFSRQLKQMKKNTLLELDRYDRVGGAVEHVVEKAPIKAQ